jgi:hypothetical protein
MMHSRSIPQRLDESARAPAATTSKLSASSRNPFLRSMIPLLDRPHRWVAEAEAVVISFQTRASTAAVLKPS